MEEEEKFLEWTTVKIKLSKSGSAPKIKNGDVWWCACGKNIGIEINGKNETFSRPVIVMSKMSNQGFMGVPLTSQKKSGPWYVEINFLGKQQFAAICQARIMSVKRLYNKMGELPESDLEKVRKRFRQLY